MSGLREIRGCEVCGGRELAPALDLGLHPLCDDLVAVGEARRCREYPIEILFCASCRTAHQRFQVPKRELFPASYHYRSRFTADVLEGMKGLVGACESRFGALAGKTVLDVGCNDGSLLDFFREKGARTIGIEPTGACRDALAKGHAAINDYLSDDCAQAVLDAHGRPSFITFTNVFAHIENLGEVLASLRRLMAPETILVIENHYLGAVLEGNQFDTFYHEHPRTYSCTSFSVMARALGLALLGVEFPSRYGGNIRVFMGPGREDAGLPAVLAREAKFAAAFGGLRRNMESWRAAKKSRLAELARRHGPLRAKAFPGRAAILVKLLGLDESSVSAVYEKPGSLKIGHYLPGTRIPIRSDDEFAAEEGGAPLLNLAWHIPGEIRRYMAARGYRGEIVDILSAEDFASAG